MPKRFGTVGAQHNEAHEEAAVTVSPEQEHRGQRPHPSPVFQNQNGRDYQHVSDLIGAVRREIGGDERRDETCRERAIKALRTAPRPQSGEGAECRHEERTEQHHATKPGARISKVDDSLPQPRVRQIERADCLLAGQRLAKIRGEAEGVGVGNLVVLYDVLAGLQVQPRIGIGHLGGEAGQQQDRGKRQNGRPEPRRHACLIRVHLRLSAAHLLRIPHSPEFSGMGLRRGCSSCR